MRILYFFMVVCLVLTFGCAGMQPERNVLQDNTFFSSASPKLKIKIHPDFMYIGKVEKQEHSEDINRRARTRVEIESFLFGHIEDNKITKGVVVRILTLYQADWYWLPDVFDWVKITLDSKIMKIQGKRYQHIVAPFRGVFSKYEEDIINEKGYIIPNCFLVKGLGRRVGADNRIKIYIIYIEDISKICDRDWTNADLLTNEQKEFLKGFIDRSEENIQIL